MADFREYAGIDASTFLMHYGKGHLDGGNSGRFKWGSGERPWQRTSMEGKGGSRDNDSNKPASRVSSRGEAKKSVKRLNKLDKQLAEARYQKYKSSQDYAKASKKSSNRKMSDAEDRMKASDHDIKAIQSEMDDIVKSLTDSGYDISTESTKRAVGKGKTAALNALGVIGAMTLGVGVFSTNKKMIGTKYKLKGTESASKEQRDADYDGDEYDENMVNLLNAHKDRYPWGSDSNGKYGGIFGKSKKQKQRERDEAWDKEVQKTIDEMSKGSEADKAWARYLEFDKSTVKNSYKSQEDYDRDSGKALDEYFRIKQQENNARDKSKMPTSNGLTESQKKAFNQAKNEDKWSIDFLEVADPDNEWSDQKMLREYKEYLKDPEGWMTRR